MKHTFLLPAMLLLLAAAVAQTGASLNVDAPGAGVQYGNVRYDNPSAVGKKITEQVDNDEIIGNPYWKTEWNKALVFLKAGSVLKLDKARLNFNTQEILYLDNNKPMVVENNLINKILFIDKNDSTKIAAAFQKLKNQQQDAFYQVLNGGTYQLWKLVTVTAKKSDYQTITGKYEYKYDSKTTYYILYGSNITLVSNLTKDHISAVVPLTPDIEQWLSAHKNKLKNEDEVIAFLTYYNEKG